MPNFTPGDVIAMVVALCSLLGNYFGMKAELKVLRNDITPLVKWWNRMAENQASRMFLRTRTEDKDQS